MRIDLHTHSSASDGSFSPADLVLEAAQYGVGVLALTDHDTTAGLTEAAAQAERCGIEFVPGIELSVCEQEGKLQCHVLGLAIDPAAEALARCSARLRSGRSARIAAMVERLQRAGIDPGLAPEQIERGAEAIGRPHLAQRLVERGYCDHPQQAFDRYLSPGKTAFVPPPELSAQEAIAVIHAAGGVAVLAHPLRSKGIDVPGGAKAFIACFARLGLDGIEVQHPAQNPQQRRKLARIAREQGLLTTGGSDFHGALRPDLRLGRGRGDIRVCAPEYRALQSAIAARRTALALAAADL